MFSSSKDYDLMVTLNSLAWRFLFSSVSPRLIYLSCLTCFSRSAVFCRISALSDSISYICFLSLELSASRLSTFFLSPSVDRSSPRCFLVYVLVTWMLPRAPCTFQPGSSVLLWACSSRGSTLWVWTSGPIINGPHSDPQRSSSHWAIPWGPHLPLPAAWSSSPAIWWGPAAPLADCVCRWACSWGTWFTRQGCCSYGSTLSWTATATSWIVRWACPSSFLTPQKIL